MKRLLAAVGGAVGAVAAFRFFRRITRLEPVGEPGGDARADELRAKLAESKPVVEEREEFEAGETPVDAAPDPETRRRDVHERTRARVDELKSSGPDEG